MKGNYGMKHAIKAYYDDYWLAESWPAEVPRGRFPIEIKALFEHYIGPETTVLDAGCGDGANYGSWLASRAGAYTGIDVSEQAVKAVLARGLTAKTVVDLSSTDFSDAQFDRCVSIEVLEHLVFPDQAAREIFRVLKPGGLLIATVPNIVYWRHRLDYALLGRWHPGGHPSGALYPWRDPHVRFFTRRTLMRMLTEVGFDIIEVRGIDGCLFGDLPFVARRFGTDLLSRPFRFLQDIFPSLFGANLAVVAMRPSR